AGPTESGRTVTGRAADHTCGLDAAYGADSVHLRRSWRGNPDSRGASACTGDCRLQCLFHTTALAVSRHAFYAVDLRGLAGLRMASTPLQHHCRDYRALYL